MGQRRLCTGHILQLFLFPFSKSSHNSQIADGLVGAIVVTGLFFALLQLPMVAADNSHDLGSQAAYAYWTLHGFSYGKDVSQNVGPLGFLAYPDVYTGFLDGVKALFHLVWTGCVVFLIRDGLKSLPNNLLRLLFVVAVALYCSGDVKFYIALLLLSHQLISTASSRIIVFATLICAVTALTKGTYFFIVLFAISVSTISRAAMQQYSAAGLTIASFSIFLLIAWMLTGQNPDDFPAFVSSMASFSSGYNDAMAIYESRETFATGLAALLSVAVPVAWRVSNCAWTFVKNGRVGVLAPHLGLAAIESLILFVVWKHGFVRASGHVMHLYGFILVASLWIVFREMPAIGNPEHPQLGPAIIAKVVLAGAAILSSWIGLNAAHPSTIQDVAAAKFRKMESSLIQLADASESRKELDRDLRANAAGLQMPKARALADSGKIGYFGITLAAMLYNDFNYVPSPSTISFASWNDRIMQDDARFFRDDARAPGYLAFELRTIDGRLSAQDNALTQLEILHRYEWIEYELGMGILRRRLGEPPLKHVHLARSEYRLGDWLEVPRNSSDPIWIRMEIGKNHLSRLIALAYKPAAHTIELEFLNGIRKKFRFVPTMAATGFLINPLIIDNVDALLVRSEGEYQKYLKNTSSQLSQVLRVRVECVEQKLACGTRADVIFETVQGLKLGAETNSAAFSKLFARVYDFDLELLEIQTPFPIAKRTAMGSVFQQFNLPGQFKFRKPPGAFKLRGQYGARSEARENGVEADGVEVMVTLSTAASPPRLLFKRDLNPRVVLKDRGEQLLDLDLPEEEGTLLLEIKPKHNPAHDQFMIRKLSLVPLKK